MKLYAAAIFLVIIICQSPQISTKLSLSALSTDDPPTELWSFDIASNSYGGASVGDIDCDGKFEVVFGTYMGDEHLYALNAEDGSLLWKVWAGPGPLDASVKLVDVTGDDRLDVVFATSGSYGSGAGVMHVLHGVNGSFLWEYDPDTCTDSPPAVADLDNDGLPEILYGTFNDGVNGGYVHILNGEDGSLVEKVGPFNGYIQSGPSVLDLDGDDQLDFVVAMFAGDNRVYAVNGSDYSTMWHFQTGDSMYHGCSFADIDEDESPELVIGSYDGNVYAINGESGSKLWDYDGTYAYFSTTIVDVDDDDYYEIVATGAFEITVLNHDGTLNWAESLSGSFRGAAIADIQGNGVLDIIVGDNDGLLTAYNGVNGDIIWSFNAASDYGITPFEIDHGPVIADLNSDGDLDVFFVGGRGYSDDPQNNYGCAYALSTSTSGIRGWSMFRHDYRNSGCYSQPIPGEVFGCVRDAYTGEPISGAIIHVDSKSSSSDANGTFIQFSEPGSTTISITKLGYNEYSIEREIIGGAIHNLDIALNPTTSEPTTTTWTSTTPTTPDNDDTSLGAVAVFLVTVTSIVAIVLIIMRRQSDN